jgi:PncC family amidohydrolase
MNARPAPLDEPYDASVSAADVGDLARRVGNLLQSSGRTIGVAESCTGGLLCAELTAVAGSSSYVLGGITAYANDLKSSLLGVSPDLLATMGAVSAEVATAMATGVRSLMGCDIGIGITGIAGPARDDSTKPVGLTYVALSAKGVGQPVEQVWSRSRDLGRAGNRRESVALALRALVAYLSGPLDKGPIPDTAG